MSGVVIGVHVHAQPEGLRATLAALTGADVLLLPDGPDAETRAALATLPQRQDGTVEPLGPPACFNRLARTGAEVIVLLESGCVPRAGWLEHLLGALRAHPRNGLAGPSTNLAWNEQSSGRGGPGDVRSLAPHHGLADFCLAVRREVLDAVGAADEGFALGPCWEMEYTARALRAGYRAVWACDAYVHREPFTERRRREEAARFAASKRRYQDAVCALRLNGTAPGYQPSCRGDACEHFAPAGLMRIHRPLSPPPPAVAVAVQASAPLVSCIMPTRERPEFARQAIRYFQRQDYAPLELVIVDDPGGELEARLPDDPRIRYVQGRPGESIGAKRNRACAEARGDYVVHWDDDDWFAPERVRRQLEPLRAGEADISALRAGVFCDLERWAFWRTTPELHARLFVEDVHGATLAYRRSLWETNPFPAVSLAEDALFLRRARRRGARLARLDGEALFVYVRHGANAWRFACGSYLDREGWRSVAEPPRLGADRAFYAARSELVSCIMPTADRPAFVARALRYFERQDHPVRELIVLDDGREPVADLIPAGAGIRYERLQRPVVLGAKRNLGCELARGEAIVHWDDDDWMAPHRLRVQLEALRSGADVTGTTRQLYLDPERRAAWLYAYPEGRRPWVVGNTLAYARDVWRRRPFPEVAVGEDTRFVWSDAVQRLRALADHRIVVGLVHGANASRKHTGDPWWTPVALGDVTAVLGADAAEYVIAEPADAARNRPPIPSNLALAGREWEVGRTRAREQP